MYAIDPRKDLDAIVGDLHRQGHDDACRLLSDCLSAALDDGDGDAVLMLAMAYAHWQGTPITERVGISMAELLEQAEPGFQEEPAVRSLSRSVH